MAKVDQYKDYLDDCGDFDLGEIDSDKTGQYNAILDQIEKESSFLFADWVDVRKALGNISWTLISKNPNPKAICLLQVWLRNTRDVGKTTGWSPKLERLVQLWTLRDFYRNPAVIEMIKQIDWSMRIDWSSRIDWSGLSLNPHPKAIQILLDDFSKINWKNVSSNSGAYELLRDNLPLVDSQYLCMNRDPRAIQLLATHLNVFSSSKDPIDLKLSQPKRSFGSWLTGRICGRYSLHLLATAQGLNWDWLSDNPAALDILKANPAKINWAEASSNPMFMELIKLPGFDRGQLDNEKLSRNPGAVPFLRDNFSLIRWDALSSNPAAIDILEKNIRYINWAALSSNPAAIDILEKNICYINWAALSSNPNAIHLFKAYPHHIDYDKLSANPGIFAADDLPESIGWVSTIQKRISDAHPIDIGLVVMLGLSYSCVLLLVARLSFAN